MERLGKSTVLLSGNAETNMKPFLPDMKVSDMRTQMDVDEWSGGFLLQAKPINRQWNGALSGFWSKMSKMQQQSF